MKTFYRIALILALIFCFHGNAQALTIVDQPDVAGSGRVAQVFPDVPEGDSFEFDDFSTAVPYFVTQLTAYGEENFDSR